MTDHKGEAAELYEAEFGRYPNQLSWDSNDAPRLANLLGAQVQATLYLAEQQRIANQVAFLAICEERGAADDAYRTLDVRVREALGLS